MAENIVVNLEVTTTGAVTNIEAVEKAVKKTAEETNKFKKEMASLTKQLLELETGSPEFEKISARLSEMKDKMKEVSETVNNNAGPAFESLGLNTATMVDQFKSLDFGGVAMSMKNMAANVKGIKMKDLSSGVSDAAKSFVTLTKALFANPIFALAGVVTAIIMNFDKLRDLIALSWRDEQKAVEAANANVTAQQEKLNAISSQENVLKLQGKSEREILMMKIEQTKQVIAAMENTIRLQKAELEAQIAAEERAKSILKGIINFITMPLRMLAIQIDAIGEGLKKIGVVSESFGLEKMLDKGVDMVADMVFSPDDVRKKGEETNKALQKQLDDAKNQLAGSQLALKAMDKKAADEANAASEAEAEERAKLEREQNKGIEAMKSRSATMIKNEYDTGIKIIDMQKRTQAALTENLALEEKKRQEIRERNLQFAKDNMVNGLEFLSNITTIFEGKSQKQQEKAFKIRKGISIAQTLISTYQGAMQAYQSQIIPMDPSSVVRGAVAAAFVVAAGLANVKKISAQKFDGAGSPPSTGGGGGGLGGGGGSQGGTPTFNPIDTSFLGNRPAQSAQAYVLAGHVSSAQDANAKVKDLRRL